MNDAATSSGRGREVIGTHHGRDNHVNVRGEPQQLAGDPYAVGSSWQGHASKWQLPEGIVDAMNTRSNPEEFVTRFADFWSSPSPQRLPEVLHPEVALVQPLAAPMIGIGAAQAEFRRIWRCLPDLRAHVDYWVRRRGPGVH